LIFEWFRLRLKEETRQKIWFAKKTKGEKLVLKEIDCSKIKGGIRISPFNTQINQYLRRNLFVHFDFVIVVKARFLNLLNS
jgi:hypothetical protein